MIKNSKRQEGFTIIEVMIVLVIAAVILLIVFLAVPALQRNSRNTQRKNEVAGMLSAMSEYTNNNGGNFPATCGATADTGGKAGTTACGNWENNVKTSIYNVPKQLGFVLNATAPATVPSVTKTDYVVLASFLKCKDTGTAATTTGASSRSYVALYAVETGNKGAVTSQCVESGS